MRAFFQEHGFVLVADLLSEVDLRDYKEGFLSSLEYVGNGKFRRDDATTWRQGLPGNTCGLMMSHGLTGVPFAWIPRLAPKVQRCFEVLFGQDRLVSLDAVCRPRQCQECIALSLRALLLGPLEMKSLPHHDSSPCRFFRPLDEKPSLAAQGPAAVVEHPRNQD